MPFRLTYTLLAAALALSACSKPLDAVIPTTEKEQHQYLEQVLPQLPAQDRDVVAAYIVGTALEDGTIPAGQTARKVLEQFKLHPESIENLGASKTAKVAKVAFQGKSIRTMDAAHGRMADQQLFKLLIENLSDQPIAGIEGILSFHDIFDNRINTKHVKILTTVPAGQAIQWTGSADINPFEASHVALRDHPDDKLKATFTIRTIVLADGTKITGP